MKDTTHSHVKTRRLMRRLEIDLAKALGTLELLWNATKKQARRGDIGAKLTDEEIAEDLAWSGKPSQLIDSLVDIGFLERHDTHRLIVHDWPDHAEDSVKKALRYYKEDFLEVYQKSVYGDSPQNCDNLPPALASASASYKPSASAAARPSKNGAESLSPKNGGAAAAAAADFSISQMLVERGVSPKQSVRWEELFPVDDLREIILFYDELLKSGRLKNPGGALKAILEMPEEKWGFSRDEKGRLIRPKSNGSGDATSAIRAAREANQRREEEKHGSRR